MKEKCSISGSGIVRIFVKHMIVSFWFAMLQSLVYADGCTHADQLFSQAVQENADQEKLLEQVLTACPSHLQGMNNLAVLWEQQGKPEQAESLYRRIIAQQGEFAAAHAGLGDALAAQRKYRESASYYLVFLKLLAHDRKQGQQNSLAAHESEYRQKLALVQEKIDTTHMVSADEIAHALADSGAMPVRAFGRIINPPHIDIHIHFGTGSDQVEGGSLAQVEQLARALQTDSLSESRFTIEGHTDSVGSSAANQALSQRRAERVKKYLVDLHGLAISRFVVVGRGKDQPIASNANEHGRALNRRVTIINDGEK